jgi:hypothetical protein
MWTSLSANIPQSCPEDLGEKTRGDDRTGKETNNLTAAIDKYY